MSFIIQPTTAVTVGTISATATASIAKGKSVTLNSDGTLTQCGITGYAITSFTTPVSATSSIGSSVFMNQILAYDPVNAKYIYIFAQVTTNYLMCVVGTLSGTTMTWGTPTVLISAYTANASIIFTTAGKFVVTSFYSDVISAVVTVSGTTPTAGTPTTVEAGAYATSGDSGTSCYDSINNKVYIAYLNYSAYQIRTYVGTISGTSISFGANVPLNSNQGSSETTYQGCAFNPTTGKIVVSISNQATSTTRIYLGTISGTTITYGTSPLTFGGYGFVSAIYEPQYKKILMTVASGRISIIGSTGTDPTEDGFVGSGTTTFNSTLSCFTVDTTKNLIYFIGNTSSSVASSYQFKILQMTSASAITVNSTTTVNATANQYPKQNSIIFDSTNSKVLITIPSPSGILGQAYAQIGYGDTTNYTGFIGFSNSNYIAGQTATIETIGNTDANQSGLTPASKYYVQTDGTLSTTPAATSVYAGTAISATTILVKGQP
jgi:hypothetical protein